MPTCIRPPQRHLQRIRECHLERIPVTFEHSLRAERNYCTLAPPVGDSYRGITLAALMQPFPIERIEQQQHRIFWPDLARKL